MPPEKECDFEVGWRVLCGVRREAPNTIESTYSIRRDEHTDMARGEHTGEEQAESHVGVTFAQAANPIPNTLTS